MIDSGSIELTEAGVQISFHDKYLATIERHTYDEDTINMLTVLLNKYDKSDKDGLFMACRFDTKEII